MAERVVQVLGFLPLLPVRAKAPNFDGNRLGLGKVCTMLLDPLFIISDVPMIALNCPSPTVLEPLPFKGIELCKLCLKNWRNPLGNRLA
jgi:hypothetical protein